MPIYEYRCERGHTFEVMQRMVEDPLATCQECEAPVQRVFHPVAVHFKGSGFYNTDYGKNKAPVAEPSGSDAKKKDSALKDSASKDSSSKDSSSKDSSTKNSSSSSSD